VDVNALLHREVIGGRECSSSKGEGIVSGEPISRSGMWAIAASGGREASQVQRPSFDSSQACDHQQIHIPSHEHW